LEPEDASHTDLGHWEGKIKMIADTVEKRITKSQKDITAQIAESETHMTERIDKLYELLSQHLSHSDDNRAATNAVSPNLTEHTDSRRDNEEENLDEFDDYNEEEY